MNGFFILFFPKRKIIFYRCTNDSIQNHLEIRFFVLCKIQTFLCAHRVKEGGQPQLRTSSCGVPSRILLALEMETESHFHNGCSLILLVWAFPPRRNCNNITRIRVSSVISHAFKYTNVFFRVHLPFFFVYQLLYRSAFVNRLVFEWYFLPRFAGV